MERVASAENAAGNAHGACVVKGPHLHVKGEGMVIGRQQRWKSERGWVIRT